MNNSDPTVHIVDDNSSSRESVRALVEARKTKAQTFISADHFLNEYQGGPGCLVTDLRMPGRSAIDLLQALRERDQSLPTIVITAYAAVPVAVEAMQKGALTLLEKPYRENELWDAVHAALLKDAESRSRELVRNEAKSRIEQLTEQEQQILAMIVDGTPNQAIADHLDMGLRTVEARRKSIMEKMHVDGVAQLVQKVLLATNDRGSSN